MIPKGDDDDDDDEPMNILLAKVPTKTGHDHL